VQNTLSSYSGGGYNLKNPQYGSFTAAYNFYDIDGDSQKEAIVFYEPSQNLGNINMAVIDKNNKKWSVVYNLESECSEIYSLSFSDLSGDGTPEIIVLWDVISNSKSHVLSVYGQKNENGEFSLFQIGKSINMNNYIPVDIDENGVNEMLVFTVDSGDSVSASAVLYSFSENSCEVLGSTKLDGHISFYKNIISESKNGRVYIYADAVKANGNQMLTEIIHWSDYYNTIVSPFYSYSTGITKNTTRSVMLSCRDINGDGLIELPKDSDRDDLPDFVTAAEWNQFENSVLSIVCCSFAVERDGYQIVLPENIFNDLRIEYSAEDSKLVAYDGNDNIVFTVLTVLKADYLSDSQAYSDYSEIMRDSGYVYLSALGTGSDIEITLDDLKSYIKSYEGE
ncbi:MAG: hypothetical protein LUG21_06605, partial [Clostridiales bacterium]|nr:hypothetical protein [Clostridiales bacterium]